MGFFSKPVLSKKRRNALDSFVANAAKALKELKKGSKGVERGLYELMLENVANTPVYFYPKKILRANFYSHGGRAGMGITQGENVSFYKIIQIGGMRKITRKSFINLPAEHVFRGDKMTLDGILTICHEYAHFPKPKLAEFAKKNRLGHETAEELLADALSAKLAVKLGFSREQVIRHFAGREIVYGKIPFKQFILRAIG